MSSSYPKIFKELAIITVLVVAMVMSIFFGLPMCNSSRKHKPGGGGAGDKSLASKGAAPPAQMRTVAINAELAAAGKRVFVNCMPCHGKDGEGKIGTGPKLNSKSFLAAASDAFLIRTIANGRPGTTMIPWGKTLSPGKIKSVVAYIRSWAPTKPAKLDNSPVKGNALAGAKTFRAICSGCHGRSGAGYMETANGTGIGRKAFLASVTNGFLRYLINHGKSGTKMRPFATKSRVAVANLSKAEIENVIAHLRKNAW